jgi:hypothetical protein
MPLQRLLRQYMYLCKSKSSKMGVPPSERVNRDVHRRLACGCAQRQYLYFCTSKASKLSTNAVHNALDTLALSDF